MKKSILSALIVILVLTACTPSPSQVPTATEEIELAAQSDTPEPSLTPSVIPSSTPTETAIPSPTPDLRVIDSDPKQIGLEAEDLPEEANYFMSNELRFSNEWVINKWGEEEATAYIEKYGRIESWTADLISYAYLPDTASVFNTHIAIYSRDLGPGEEFDWSGLTICDDSYTEITPVDIGVEAYSCSLDLSISGDGLNIYQEYFGVYGLYRNVAFVVSVMAKEPGFSMDILVGLAQLQAEKILGFPLTDEVTYSP